MFGRNLGGTTPEQLDDGARPRTPPRWLAAPKAADGATHATSRQLPSRPVSRWTEGRVACWPPATHSFGNAVGHGYGLPIRRSSSSDTTCPMRDTRLPWIVITAVAFVVIVLVVLSVTVFPALLIDPPAADQLEEMTAKDRLDAQNDVRQTLLQAIAGLLLLAGGVATWENVQIARSRRHLEEQGQVTERFTRAVDQLGHKERDVHIGGIYALERIARDSPNDRGAIAEVLAAFVRGHAPRRDDVDPYDIDPDIDVGDLAARAPDVQAALTVLGRLPATASETEYLFDLKKTELRGADLMGANLRDADLVGADLVDASLVNADLRDANLVGANLVDAHLYGANLRGAHLEDANLRDADLDAADLEGAFSSPATVWPATFDTEGRGILVVTEEGWDILVVTELDETGPLLPNDATPSEDTSTDGDGRPAQDPSGPDTHG